MESNLGGLWHSRPARSDGRQAEWGISWSHVTPLAWVQRTMAAAVRRLRRIVVVATVWGSWIGRNRSHDDGTDPI